MLPQLRNLQALQFMAPHLYLQHGKTLVAEVSDIAMSAVKQQQ